jgi:alkanesulfonate monooxygenase SsuD/methylene tetrahydromethanopterin reductase-like flavin-dependent oxidoreductase (luciferase family)
MTRHLVVADTDAEAVRTARHAYDDFNAKLRWLWDRAGQASPILFLPNLSPILASP